MNTRINISRSFFVWIVWWIPTWFLLAWLLGWCAGQAACPTVATAPSANTCTTSCPSDRVCMGNECLYPCSNDADCEAIGDPRIPVCSNGVCVAGTEQ